VESIYTGELCPSCGEVTLDAEDGEQVERPNRGAVLVLSGNQDDGL